MKTAYLDGKKWLFILLFLFFGAMEARADIQLWEDKFILTGFLRQELAVHVAPKNPNNEAYQDSNNRINLSRSFFLTEWILKPNDVFKFYSKMRLIHDQTDMLEDDLLDYNAFPLSTPRYGSYLRPTDDDNIVFEVCELYGEADLGNLWLRLGKQQIVWGEMISARIMDIINPLDYSWHFMFEPEEFENIRIPEWAARMVYNFDQDTLPWFSEAFIEGFYNPGDVSPNINPQPGAPFKFTPDPSPVFVTNEKERWGDDEFGFRIGGRVGQFFGTLNYFNVYTDSGYWQYVSGGPRPPFFTDIKYPKLDIYGLSMNYAIQPPIDTTVTFEGTYTPEQPYYDIQSAMPEIVEEGQWKWALQLQRSTFVFPTPISAMNLRMQFTQTAVDGNPDKLKSTPAPFDRKSNKVDKTQNVLAFLADQYFWSNQILINAKVIYDMDGAYYMVPGFKYAPGDYWYFDIYGVFLGGSDRRAGTFASMYWSDEVFARITYQF